MSFGKSEFDFLESVGKGYHERFLSVEEKRKRRAALKRKEDPKQQQERAAKRERHHDIRMAKIGADLRREEYSGPEFSSSIPTAKETLARLVSRGPEGFQSPVESPPRTPEHRAVPLVRTTTPVVLPGFDPGHKKKPMIKFKIKQSARTGKGKKKPQVPRAPRKPLHDPDSDEAVVGGDSDTSVEYTGDEKMTESESETDTDEFSYIRDEGRRRRLRHQKRLKRIREKARQLAERKRAEQAARQLAERRRARARALRLRHVGVAARARPDIPAFLAERARQKKEQRDFKQQRLAKRHTRQTIRTVHPFVPKLQISQQGPGKFKVRATGITPAVLQQVKTLLSRVTGKLFVNTKFVSMKRAFSVIVALLRKKEVVMIQIR